MQIPPIILSIAGYDPSSGAGVTADIKTAAANDCYAVTCITVLTIQSTQGVAGVEAVKPELVSATLQTLVDDLPIGAIRIGMLGLGEIVEVVADFLKKGQFRNVVLDPVIRSSSGTALLTGPESRFSGDGCCRSATLSPQTSTKPRCSPESNQFQRQLPGTPPRLDCWSWPTGYISWAAGRW